MIKGLLFSRVLWSYWWYVSADYGNDLVPSGNKPLPESMMATFTYMLMCQYGTAGYQITANKYIMRDKFENLHQRCHHYGYISHVIVHKNIFSPSVVDTPKFLENYRDHDDVTK